MNDSKPAILRLQSASALFIPTPSMLAAFRIVDLTLEELSMSTIDAVGLIAEIPRIDTAFLNVVRSLKARHGAFCVCLITPDADEEAFWPLAVLTHTVRFTPGHFALRCDTVMEELEKLFLSVWGNKRYTNALKMRSRRSGLVDSLGMVSHQWRQPINLISMEAINLMIQTGIEENIKSASVAKSAQIVSDQAQRMSDILKSVLSLGKVHRAKELFSIRELFERIASLWSEQLKQHDIELLVPHPVQDAQVYGYQTDLEEVLINLVANAKDAYTGAKTSGRRFISLEVRLDQSHLYLSVRDEAGGVPEPLREQIFQPDFSTKNKDEGFGIGLHVARLIIEQEFKGSLELTVGPKGSSFIATLPRNDLCSLRFID